MGNKDTASEPTSAEVAWLLGHLESRFEQRREVRAQQAETEAPRFTPFAYITTSECGLSRILGDLLNPRAAHGQRERFLQLFLNSVGLDALVATPRSEALLEDSTFAQSTQRRIDLVLRDRDWLVGIEHKPWASDQGGQIADYLKELRLRGARRFHLLYITTDGRLPSPGSIPEEACAASVLCGELKTVSYSQIASWLERCIEQCQAERVTWFLRALRDFVLNAVPAPKQDEDSFMIVETLLDPANRTHLPAVLQLLQAREALRRELMQRLMSALRSRLPDWTVMRELSLEDFRLGFRPPQADGWYFCIECSGGRWCYGIRRDAEASDEQRTRLSLLGEQMRQVLPAAGRATDDWPVWFWFRGIRVHDLEVYSNWENSIQPWVDMSDGTMAEHFAELALMLRESVLALQAKPR